MDEFWFMSFKRFSFQLSMRGFDFVSGPGHFCEGWSFLFSFIDSIETITHFFKLYPLCLPIVAEEKGSE